MTELSMPLLENSDSFLQEALRKAIQAEREPSEWKFAIFSLVQAVELCLKARLRDEHPILIYDNIDKPIRTISLDKALNRLSNIANVCLTKEDVKAIEIAREWRNAIVHYEFILSIPTAKAAFAQLLGFLTTFNRQHLKREVSAGIQPELWTKAIEIRHYANELYERALLRIKEENITKICTCIKCWYDTFVWERNIDQCYLCGFADKGTVCQECGKGLFSSEAHKVYYGKWYRGNPSDGKLEDWYPDLCDDCCEEYLEKKKEENNSEAEE